MNINRAIRSIMAEKGIRAIDLARATGLHSSNISAAIGVNSNPTVKTLSMFAGHLNVKLSDIIIKAESIEVEK